MTGTQCHDHITAKKPRQEAKKEEVRVQDVIFAKTF